MKRPWFVRILDVSGHCRYLHCHNEAPDIVIFHHFKEITALTWFKFKLKDFQFFAANENIEPGEIPSHFIDWSSEAADIFEAGHGGQSDHPSRATQFQWHFDFIPQIFHLYGRQKASSGSSVGYRVHRVLCRSIIGQQFELSSRSRDLPSSHWLADANFGYFTQIFNSFWKNLILINEILKSLIFSISFYFIF